MTDERLDEKPEEKHDEVVFRDRTDLSQLHESVQQLRAEIGKLIVGQTRMVDLLLAGILSNGHILIEGVPGVAKTLTAKLLARALDVPFARIQFTPDLMPSDVLGTSVFHPSEGTFEFRRGPVFSSIVLIDEINRSPAKTQAALFEVMEERQVTVDGHTYPMDRPFMVVATQNPVEHEGTYRLPEAQLDRFLFKIEVPYPTLDEEVQILLGHHQADLDSRLASIGKVIDASQIIALQASIRSIHTEEKLIRYIAEIIGATRTAKSVFLGASPRASVSTLIAAKAIAAMQGRDFVTPDDILFVIKPVLRHRIVLTPEKEMEGLSTDEVIDQIVQGIEIPR